MTTSYNEIKNLIQQHQAIQAHMKFLINSLSTLSTQSNQDMPYSIPLKDRIALYRWSLYDFKEAIQLQIELDDRIFLGTSSTEDILREHQGIREQINIMIQLAENAVYHNISQEELNIYSLNIIKAVNNICESLEQHITKEDNLLKQRLNTRVLS
jgi:hemerythrin-like domain-containing protein